jgi:hypothetical protein
VTKSSWNHVTVLSNISVPCVDVFCEHHLTVRMLAALSELQMGLGDGHKFALEHFLRAHPYYYDEPRIGELEASYGTLVFVVSMAYRRSNSHGNVAREIRGCEKATPALFPHALLMFSTFDGQRVLHVAKVAYMFFYTGIHIHTG